MSECLIRLRLRHAWSDGQRLNGLGLVAEAQTAAILHRYDLWSRFDDGEWALYSGRAGNAATLMAGLTRALEGGALCLRLTGDMAFLAAITCLPGNLRTLPHFTSRAVEADAVEGTDLRHLTPQADGAGPGGTVWLYPEDISQAPPGTTWSIRFAARALPWICYVVNRSRSPLHQPFIRASDGRVLSGPVDASLPDGDTALRFDTGEQSLTFSKVPTLRFGLFDRFRSPLSDQPTEICLMRSLPLPDPRSVLWDGDGPGQRVSAATTVYL